jgi:simple sugar transport system ATP-binding protein
MTAAPERGAPATPAPRGGAPAPPALALRGVTKRFPGIVANDRVDFEAAVGEVHALLGENGAGKSTLSNIVTGLYRPDEGELRIDGRPVRFASPRDAIDARISMVHQHFRLVEPFTVAENIALGDHRGESARFLLDPRAVELEVSVLGERYGLPVDPRARIWQLSVGEQQRVEILKALHRDARILILDEPTAVLTPQEASTLFVTLRAMAAEGRTIVFISHKLHEVAAVADRVTVLRRGRVVGTASVAETTPQSLAAMMVGRAVAGPVRTPRPEPSGDPVLEVVDVAAAGDRGSPALRGVSLRVRAGEILGVAGVAGNGQRELAELVAGLRAPSAGQVRVGGRPLRAGDPRAAISRHIAYVPEDRLATGVAPSLSVAWNTALKSYRRPIASLGPLLRRRRVRRRAAGLIERYRIDTTGPDAPARQLSGGNLQKVVLAREFSEEPVVLVAASPTRGLDVGAIETVHAYLRRAAADGMAILLISEDLDEILALADRVAVMYEGRIVGEVPAEGASVEEIGLLMAGGARGGREGAPEGAGAASAEGAA